MMPSQEAMKVLQMIESGQITAEEGVRLLAGSPNVVTEPVVNQAAPVVEPVPAPQPVPEATPAIPPPAPALSTPEHSEVTAPAKGWFRVRVTDMKTNRNKVTVNLPLSLVSAGLKIGAHYAPELNGMNLTEVFNELRTSQPGKIVEVIDEEDGEHVEIFIE